MAETDAHHRLIGVANGADQVFQRRDEGVIFVSAMFRAGDEPGIGGLGSVGEIHIDHIEDPESESMPAQKPLEHMFKIAVAGL